MSKLNRREFKELLSEWRNNFVNERMNKSSKSTLKNFITSKESNNELIEFPITLINFDVESEVVMEDALFALDEITNTDYDFVRENLNNNAGTKVLYNNESNRNKLTNSRFFNRFLSQENINRFVSASYDENIIIQAEIGDFLVASSDNKKFSDKEIDVSKKIFTLHDLYHTTLDKSFNPFLIYTLDNLSKKSLESKQLEFDYSLNSKEERISYDIFQKYILKKLSGEIPHIVDVTDFLPSLFAFLFLFVMVYDKSQNKIDIEKSIENIDRIKNEISSFTYKPHYPNNYNSENQNKITNVDVFIAYLKDFFKDSAKIFQELYLDNIEKYIIISVVF